MNAEKSGCGLAAETFLLLTISNIIYFLFLFLPEAACIKAVKSLCG